ncbi:MAG: CoA transferase [Candidatus Hydrogenedentota bacterium]
MSTTKVLEGVRVLDFGRFIAAPYCGMILADMGAEVIRIDRPGGEEDRTVGLKSPNGENLSYPSYARNKKGVSLNVLSKDADRGVLEDLVKKCDVFLHNFSPGAIKAFGLTYEDIKAIKPDIIYTGISCYGATGPYADRSGFDQIAQTFSGAAALTGYEGDPPLRSGLPWVDYSTGLCATVGTLLALRHRDATGEGQMVDCALLQTAMSFIAPMVAEANVLGREKPRIGNRSAYFGPTDLYKCSDGYVYIATTMEGMWRRLMKIIGREDFVGKEGFVTDIERFENREQVDPLVTDWMKGHTVDEVTTIMDDNRIPCGIYHSTAEVAADPHVQARKMLEYMDLGVPGLENVPLCGIPIQLSETPGSVREQAPAVGQHNDEFYRDLLGYNDERLAELRESGTI